MKDIEIIKFGEPGFSDLWNRYQQTEITNVFYSLPYLNFLEKITAAFVENVSLLLVQESQPVALAPLIVEQGASGNQFSVRSQYLLPAPLFSSRLSDADSRAAEQALFHHLAELAAEKNIVLHQTVIDPLVEIQKERSFNYLLLHGYQDQSMLTRIIDLRASPSVLWSGVRKSVRSLINAGSKYLQTEIVDYQQCSRKQLSEFAALYRLAAGREVYSQAAWDILYEMIANDEAMLALVSKDGQCLGGGYFHHGKIGAYYSLGANHPDYEKDFPISHFCIWKTIEYYRGRGLRWFEIGWQYYPGNPEATAKEISISFFKRAFGGRDYPLFRGLKFFYNDVHQQYLNNLIQHEQ